MSVSSRRCDELQSGTDGLGDACTAGPLRLFKQFAGYLHGDLANCFHSARQHTVFNTSSESGMPLDEAIGIRTRAQSIGDLAFQSPTGVHLTPAGWYSMLVSAPVVQFLGAVVLWRWLLRTIFAFRLSRLNLRLIPSHPDENGGLGSFPFLPRLSCRYLLQYPLSLELHSAMTSCSRFSFSASCMLVVNPQHAICSRLLVVLETDVPFRLILLLEKTGTVQESHTALTFGYPCNTQPSNGL